MSRIGFRTLFPMALKGICFQLGALLLSALPQMTPGRVRDARAALCTSRAGVPERTHADLHIHALVTFTPSSLPAAIFAFLRKQDCKLNKVVLGKWDLRRTSVAVHISELWHVLTSHKKCTRRWFEAYPRFVDLEGFLRVPENPHTCLPVAASQVCFVHNTLAGSQDCLSRVDGYCSHIYYTTVP